MLQGQRKDRVTVASAATAATEAALAAACEEGVSGQPAMTEGTHGSRDGLIDINSSARSKEGRDGSYAVVAVAVSVVSLSVRERVSEKGRREDLTTDGVGVRVRGGSSLGRIVSYRTERETEESSRTLAFAPACARRSSARIQQRESR